MKPKVMIRLSKRFLIVAAILILVTSSSAAVIPTHASNSKIVYVAICSDSEMWGGAGSYVGSANPHLTMDVREYSRTVPMTVAAVFDSVFRNSTRDSFGNVFKMSWFAEMDYIIAQSSFVWADGSSAGVSGYTAIRDLLVNNWGTQIQAYGDSVEYHHHFVIYDGTWKEYDDGPDAGYPEYQMYALDHMIIDRGFYPSTWRSGWWIMPPALSSWLEQWMPFDYTPQTGIWFPVHPSGLDRWQTACPYAPDVTGGVNSAFAYARDHGSAVYSLCTHDSENMRSQVAWLQYNLATADANEAAYPDVSFKYVSAREAMQLALGFTDFTSPTFTITPSGGTYTIVSSEPLWKNHPYIALKYADGTYGHKNATPAGINTWTVTPLSSVSIIGVAGSDLYGNPGTAAFTQYALTVDTVGSGSVTKSPDQIMYASGTVVTLTATPQVGWSFSHWGGDASGTVNPITVNMTSDKTVTATFTPKNYSLTVTPVGSGSVNRNNSGPYYYGDVVQLTAVPNTGWSFDHWSEDLNGSISPKMILIDGNKTVNATFTQNAYSLTISYAGDGSGSVSTDLSAPYHYGDVVKLTATPADGSRFSGWSGDHGGYVNPTNITIDGNKVVTATFVRIVYTLTIHTTGSGSVSTDRSAPYYWGDVVQLTATPATYWSFQSWGGDLSGSANITTITMKADHDVTANFMNIPPSVSVSPSLVTLDAGQSQLLTSSISGGPSPFSYQWYLNGVAVSGATNATWAFVPTSAGSYTVYLNVTDSVGVIATSNTATVTVNGVPSVTILPSTVTLYAGQSQTFTSTVVSGTSPYQFQWYLDGTPEGTNSTSWAYTFSSTGTYAVSLSVTDSVGIVASSSVTVKVKAAPDVAITNVVSSKTVVGQGSSVSINVTVANLGNYSEVFNVTVYANTLIIGERQIALASGDSTVISFAWNTASVPYSHYNLTAYASPVTGETDSANNRFVFGIVTVTILGDVNGDGKVNVLDLIFVALRYQQSNGGGTVPYSTQWYQWRNCDFNNDNKIDILDLIACGLHLGQHW